MVKLCGRFFWIVQNNETESVSVTTSTHRSSRELFNLGAAHAIRYREGLAARSPKASLESLELEQMFDGPTPEAPEDGVSVLNALADAAEAGITSPASAGFFGWVVGGSHPIGVAADMMTSAWGQNAAGYTCSPASSTAEKICSRWLLDILRLPPECSVGFVSGATMAAFTCLAAARTAVLQRLDWDVEHDGLFGAPRIRVFAGDGVHSTLISAIRYLGLGSKVVEIETDSEGRMDVQRLNAGLSLYSGPKIVIANAGQINTGSFDRFSEIAPVCKRHGAWLHIDGAFGLWAQLLPEKSGVLAGIEQANSWSTDGHKWLQLPYDSGFAIVRDAEAHMRAMAISASYLVPAEAGQYDPSQFVPELSRRARGFPLWAMLRGLGRQGIADMVRKHCALAKRLADIVSRERGISVINEIVLNQLILTFGEHESHCTDKTTRAVISRLEQSDQYLVLGAEWKGRQVLRVSIVSPATEREDIDSFAEALIRAWRDVRNAGY